MGSDTEQRYTLEILFCSYVFKPSNHGLVLTLIKPEGLIFLNRQDPGLRNQCLHISHLSSLL